MNFKSLGRFFTIVFMLATFVSVFHHHDDLKVHNDCQICTIQSNIANADTPSENVYLSEIELFSQSVISKLPNQHECQICIPLRARAPPFIS